VMGKMALPKPNAREPEKFRSWNFSRFPEGIAESPDVVVTRIGPIPRIGRLRARIASVAGTAMSAVTLPVIGPVLGARVPVVRYLPRCRYGGALP